MEERTADAEEKTADAEERTPNVHRFAPAAPDEEFVFGACAPSWHTAASHEAALEDWLSFVQSCDVERACCLLSGRKLDSPDGTVERYYRTFGDENVLHAPLVDRRLADVTVLRDEILPFLDAAATVRQRVVVHCLDGIGRTGQVLAAWLAYDRGYAPERAVDTVEEMGRLPDQVMRDGTATGDDLYALLDAVRGA